MADAIISRADAKAQGLKRFFTGLPCRHGHAVERYVKDGKCVRCVAIRAAISSRTWNAKNPDKRKAVTQRWRTANPDQFKASTRASKERFKDKYNERQLAEYRANPERFKAAWKRYYEKHKQYHVDRAAAAGRMRRAQRKGAGGSHTPADLAEILKAQKHRCASCRADLRKVKRHIDHIIPLSRGGSDARANLQYLCAPCNLAKGAQDPVDYARKRGLLI